MYNETLTEKIINTDDLFLDPNNPRFWSEKSQSSSEVSDKKTPDPIVQSKAMDAISRHGIEELKKSILRNGFLPLDRIVVRELESHPGKFVAIEGNRRLAAVKSLRKDIGEGTVAEEGLSSEELEKLVKSTDALPILVYQGSEKDISWILQGIRHIGGIREWSPAQQGKLVADQIDNEHLSLSSAGQRFGLTAQAVGRRYRSYKALEQMRSDEEFKAKAKNDFYSLFEEAVGRKEIKLWLGWDETENKFKDSENLKQFYSWICPDDTADSKRRLHDPRHIKYLSQVLASSKRDALINQIDSHEIEIEAAAHKVKDNQVKFDWRIALEEACEYIDSIPNASLENDTQLLLEAIADLESKVTRLRKQAEAIAKPKI